MICCLLLESKNRGVLFDVGKMVIFSVIVLFARRNILMIRLESFIKHCGQFDVSLLQKHQFIDKRALSSLVTGAIYLLLCFKSFICKFLFFSVLFTLRIESGLAIDPVGSAFQRYRWVAELIELPDWLKNISGGGGGQTGDSVAQGFNQMGLSCTGV